MATLQDSIKRITAYEEAKLEELRAAGKLEDVQETQKEKVMQEPEIEWVYNEPNTLGRMEFSDADIRALYTLETVLKRGEYPKIPFSPVGKPYIVKNFEKTARAHLKYVREYIRQEVFGEYIENGYRPGFKSVLRGIVELAEVLGEYNYQARQSEQEDSQ